MRFEKYYVCDKSNKSNCVIRTFCKLFGKQYDDVKKELLDIALQLNYDNYNEIEVFEKYLSDKGYLKLKLDNDIKIKDLNLKNGKYAVFCCDRKEFYHMLSIIDGIIYDKDDTCLDLYVINVYGIY